MNKTNHFNPKLIPILPKYILEYNIENLDPKFLTDNSLWLEFGVFSGRTINFLSKYVSKSVYGFDSFEGLPEDWREGFKKGKFNMGGMLPKVEDNVILIKGWFNNTLESFLKTHTEDISFIHMDADLYSSTKYVLEKCTPRIKKGCIISFDEIFNFPEYDNSTSELRALKEWVDEYEVEFDWLGICPLFTERASIRIKHINNI
jgi:hypothetical protein